MIDPQESAAFALLKQIKAQLPPHDYYANSWEEDARQSTGEHEAGMVVWMADGETHRQFRIVVTDLGTADGGAAIHSEQCHRN